MNQEVNLLWFDKLVNTHQKEFSDHMWNALREFMEWNEGVTEIFNELDQEDGMEYVEKFEAILLESWIKSTQEKLNV
jgi:hypothetical protein